MSCAVLTEAQAGSKGEKCSQTKQTNGSLKNGAGGGGELAAGSFSS